MIRLVRPVLIAGSVAVALITTSLFGQDAGQDLSPAPPAPAKLVRSTPAPPPAPQLAGTNSAAPGQGRVAADATVQKIATASVELRQTLSLGQPTEVSKFIANLSAKTKYRIGYTRLAQRILADGIARRQLAKNDAQSLTKQALGVAATQLTQEDIAAIFDARALSLTGFKEPADKAGLDKQIKEQNERARTALAQRKQALALGAGAAPGAPNKSMAKFNWTLPSVYTTGIVTAVQDQNNPNTCQPGVCWAFATVGAFEAAYALANGVLIGASEQYLLDCSQSNLSTLTFFNFPGQTWDCGGGFWAFPMLTSDPAAGGVSDPGLPQRALLKYDANIDSCPPAGTFSKPYQATTWGYVLEASTLPPNDQLADQLKSALCTYGPLAVGVWGNAITWPMNQGDVLHDFPNGGVGNDGRPLNHAVVLVGWDDNLAWTDDTGAAQKGAWMIKNSWGVGYGIPDANGVGTGFLYVAYGSNTLGWGAAFVVPVPRAGN